MHVQELQSAVGIRHRERRELWNQQWEIRLITWHTKSKNKHCARGISAYTTKVMRKKKEKEKREKEREREKREKEERVE